MFNRSNKTDGQLLVDAANAALSSLNDLKNLSRKEEEEKNTLSTGLHQYIDLEGMSTEVKNKCKQYS